MDKVLKIIQIIIALLNTLLPLLEVFGKDDSSKENVDKALALLKDVREKEKLNC